MLQVLTYLKERQGWGGVSLRLLGLAGFFTEEYSLDF